MYVCMAEGAEEQRHATATQRSKIVEVFSPWATTTHYGSKDRAGLNMRVHSNNLIDSEQFRRLEAHARMQHRKLDVFVQAGRGGSLSC
jgi:hypothetical protein